MAKVVLFAFFITTVISVLPAPTKDHKGLIPSRLINTTMYNTIYKQNNVPAHIESDMEIQDMGSIEFLHEMLKKGKFEVTWGDFRTFHKESILNLRGFSSSYTKQQ